MFFVTFIFTYIPLLWLLTDHTSHPTTTTTLPNNYLIGTKPLTTPDPLNSMPNCLNMTRTSTQKPPLLSVTLLILFYLLIVLKKTPFDVTMYVCVSCMSFSAFNFDVDQLCVIKRRVMENYHFSVCPCLLLIFAVANRSGTTCASCL